MCTAIFSLVGYLMDYIYMDRYLWSYSYHLVILNLVYYVCANQPRVLYQSIPAIPFKFHFKIVIRIFLITFLGRY